MALYFRAPFPDANLFLHVMAIRSASAFLFFKYSYTLFLYTTPYIAFSVLFSGFYIFALKATRKIRAGKLPLYPDPAQRTELSLVVGELHYPRTQMPSETPRWLVIPERGLFTVIAIVGAVGWGKEPLWQQGYTNVVKFIILLHKVAFDYVTLFDVYECAINPELLESRIKEAERRLIEADSVLLWKEEYLKYPKDLEPFQFRLDTESNRYRAPLTPGLASVLKAKAVQWEAENASRKNPVPAQKKAQLEAVRRWFFHDWRRIEPKLRTSIVEGISVFLSLFDDNPDVKRTFCPPAECYDTHANADFKFGKPLPSFSWLIETGAVCGLNFPIGMNPGLAKAVGVMMKLDFERAVLNRVPVMEKNPESYFRQVLFLCDEYQHFATVGENEPTGDEKFFSLSRQPKCIPIIATQSISSLKSALPGESWRTLLQTFRTKIFLSLSDDFSARNVCSRV